MESSLPQSLGMPERLPQAWLPCTGGAHTSEPEAGSRQLISSQDTGTDLDLSLFSGLLPSCWGNRICSLGYTLPLWTPGTYSQCHPSSPRSRFQLHQGPLYSVTDCNPLQNPELFLRLWDSNPLVMFRDHRLDSPKHTFPRYQLPSQV